MAEKKGLDPEILACLKQVIQIMKEDDLSEVCIQQKDMKIQVTRMSDQPVIATQGMAMLTANEETLSLPATELDGLVVIAAPMVGTFYRAASPEAEPFVNVGDEIDVDQVICVIDAMKLMNEITADLSGEIVEILVQDGQPVEYDQSLFRVRPR
ncbi:acetyl-CoA carboxylase biotin carboxyl carrier protein [Candidatus Poribacteria bacterium]